MALTPAPIMAEARHEADYPAVGRLEIKRPGKTNAGKPVLPFALDRLATSSARVGLANAGHFVWCSNPNEATREMNAFTDSLQ